MPASQPVNSRAFFSATPVFRRQEYASAVGRASNDPLVTTMLAQHLRAGNIRRVARGVFASVPAHGDAASWSVDRFLAASRLRQDAVIAYHSALELHGCAYTDAAEVQVIASGEPGSFDTKDFSCRFLKAPKGFDPSNDIVTFDRLGLAVNATTLERTIADLFDRYDLAGGAEELVSSLDLVERIKAEIVVRHARKVDNSAAAGALGWWLAREKSRLAVSPDILREVRTLAPKHAQYALGAKRGSGKLAADWNVILPAEIVDRTFEGV